MKKGTLAPGPLHSLKERSEARAPAPLPGAGSRGPQGPLFVCKVIHAPEVKA